MVEYAAIHNPQTHSNPMKKFMHLLTGVTAALALCALFGCEHHKNKKDDPVTGGGGSSGGSVSSKVTGITVKTSEVSWWFNNKDESGNGATSIGTDGELNLFIWAGDSVTLTGILQGTNLSKNNKITWKIVDYTSDLELLKSWFSEGETANGASKKISVPEGFAGYIGMVLEVASKDKPSISTKVVIYVNAML